MRFNKVRRVREFENWKLGFGNTDKKLKVGDKRYDGKFLKRI